MHNDIYSYNIFKYNCSMFAQKILKSYKILNKLLNGLKKSSLNFINKSLINLVIILIDVIELLVC